MAARDPDQSPAPRAARAPEPPLDAYELAVRLDEEIGRAERHGTKLSCLLVLIDNLDDVSREHGGGLAEQTVTYVADALARELRRFDRVGRPAEGELAVVLPGADSPLGEVVARRLLERINTIKVESRGTRRPLEIAVGLAAWQPRMTAAALLERARAAAQRQNGEDPLPARLAGAEGGPADVTGPSATGTHGPAGGGLGEPGSPARDGGDVAAGARAPEASAPRVGPDGRS